MIDRKLVESVQDFVKKALAPCAGPIDASGDLPQGHWAAVADFGLAGLAISPDQGGLGVDRSTFVAILEALGGGCASTAWTLLTHCTAGAGIAALGSEAQKQRYLPGLAAGSLSGAFAVTETGGGSNPGSIRTSARREGDGYVLQGSKFFISQAGVADIYLIMVRTGTEPGPAALSCFLLEKSDVGVSFGKREDTLGVRGVQVREIHLDGCRLPAERLLGKPGGAQAVLGAVSWMTALGSAAAALGIAQAAFDTTLEHVRNRIILGKPLATVPAVQARLANILLEMETARGALGRGLDWLADGAKGAPLPLWMCKVAVTRTAAHVVDECLALHGAVGYSRALPLERHARDVKAFGIHWGNNDVLLDMAGKMMLA